MTGFREKSCGTRVMRKSGMAEKYVRLVQDMYEESETVVRCALRRSNYRQFLYQGRTAPGISVKSVLVYSDYG